jgi:hypothetical protein
MPGLFFTGEAANSTLRRFCFVTRRAGNTNRAVRGDSPRASRTKCQANDIALRPAPARKHRGVTPDSLSKPRAPLPACLVLEPDCKSTRAALAPAAIGELEKLRVNKRQG